MPRHLKFTHSSAILWRGCAFFVAALAGASCAKPEDPDDRGVSITADTTRGLNNTTVMLGRFTGSELRRLRNSDSPFEAWTKSFRVSVSGDTTPIIGRYSVTDTSIQFQPAFPFDLGREYDVRVYPQTLASRRRASMVEGHFRLPAPDLKPSTRVTHIYPTSDTLPENQLRFYVTFSAPMSREGGLPYVRLIDADGNEVKSAFLPLDGDFWNADRTRYTLFLDPGRVKRGILPNDQMGRALIARQRYSIVVDSAWRDGRGQPLVASYAKRFRADGADFRPIRLADWRVDSPKAGTTEPLTVRFPEPLDWGLLNRAIGVVGPDGKPIDASLDISRGEERARFVPRAPWASGSHQIVILDFLEDLAGNRVNRAFEADLFTRADSTPTRGRFTVPFVVK